MCFSVDNLESCRPMAMLKVHIYIPQEVVSVLERTNKSTKKHHSCHIVIYQPFLTSASNFRNTYFLLLKDTLLQLLGNNLASEENPVSLLWQL